MESTKKGASPAAASKEAKKGPVKTFTANDVSASVFCREYNDRTYYSVTFNRWYRDKTGQNRYINSFSLDDLAKVVSVAQMADEYIRDLVKPEIE